MGTLYVFPAIKCTSQAVDFAVIHSPDILYERLPVWQETYGFGVEIRLQSYIRPMMQTISLLALMEFAGKVLIS